MQPPASTPRQIFSLYGLAVDLHVNCRALVPEIDRIFKPFPLHLAPANTVWTSGTIKPFNLDEISRQISPSSAPVAAHKGLVELYTHDERHWLIDERWGMCQINVLKRNWRTWVLPRTSLDPVRLAEAAILWPMTQLLRTRGLQLIPAISIERNGWGALILAPYDIQSEIARLIRAGYRVIGQRWTALRIENGRMMMLRMPGVTPAPTPARAETRSSRHRPLWFDITASNPWASADRCVCSSVFMIEPGRRAAIHGRELLDGSGALRRAWPMLELPRHRRSIVNPVSQLARHGRCFLVQLSRREDDFVQLLEKVRRKHTTVQSIAA